MGSTLPFMEPHERGKGFLFGFPKNAGFGSILEGPHSLNAGSSQTWEGPNLKDLV